MKRHVLESRGNVVVVPVKLEAHGATKARFVVDTGATFVMVTWRVAHEIGLRPETSLQRSAITTASGTETAPFVMIPAVTVLEHRVEEVIAAVHDLPPQAGVDGLLGLSFLKHFRLVVDFKEGYLELG